MNVIVSNSKFTQRDIDLLFENEQCIFTDATNITDLVVELNLYKSKSQARSAGRVGEIPTGWTEYKGNKTTNLWIWNPDE